MCFIDSGLLENLMSCGLISMGIFIPRFILVGLDQVSDCPEVPLDLTIF